MSIAAGLLIWAVIVIVSLIAVSYAARRWGRDPFGWALLAVVLGPIALAGLVGSRQSDVARPEPFERVPDGQAADARDRIIAAVDGSPSGGRVARYIAAMHRQDVEAVVLVVFPHEERPRDGGAVQAEHRARIEAATAEPLRVLREAGIAASVLVGYGVAGEEIVRCAGDQRAAAIVVGRRGSGVTRALLGSVSEHVVKHAAQPVVVVE
ncbi:MAG: universal stress protein [Chloroflexi bacterium]|nr:universal stress protein [Chloroflexota bacterium]